MGNSVIVVKLMGGMGNQLFQYAAGYNLGNLLNQEVYFDIRCYQPGGKRKFELQGLPICIFDKKVENARGGKIYRIQNSIVNRYCKYASRKDTKKVQDLLTRIGIYLEFDTGDIAKYPYECLKNRKNIFLCGYFQDPKVFINNYFEITQLYKRLLSEYMVKDMNTICVHIRTDDYIGNPLFHICTQKYYNMAIEIIKEKRPNANILVFSDDVEYVKKNIRINYQYEFCLEKKARKAMALMASCSYFVLSNSTYSWWAQELCEAKDKIVVAPSKWDGKNKNCYIYEKNWILVDP